MKKLIITLAFILFAGVAFGQSLEKGGIVALHKLQISVATGVSIDQYLEFWETRLVPEIKKAFPEMSPYLLKGIGEDNKELYAGLYIYKSMDVLREYWKEDGTATEKGAAAMAKLQPLLEELSQLGTYTQKPSDWVVIGK